MKGRNFRRVLCLVIVLSVVSITCLAVMIWMLAAKPFIVTQRVSSTTEAPDTLPNKLKLQDYSINLSTGELVYEHEGTTLLKASIHDLLASDKRRTITDCGTSNQQICLITSDGYRLDIKQGEQTDEASCYSFTHSTVEDNVTVCFDYDKYHWYGAAETHAQYWPVEKWSLSMQEFIAKDPYHPGVYGSVIERYWLSSAGVALHVPLDVPLHVSMNALNDSQLCFKAQFKRSLYRNVRGDNLRLKYDICSSNNMTSLHQYMSRAYWSKPIDRPNLEAMVKPIWSTWATYKKNINQTTVLEYADRILNHNMSISQLEIDDDWTPAYGDWEFSTTKFSDPKAMVDELKSKNIPAVTLWVHPFVAIDAKSFKETAGLVMITSDSKPPVPGLVRWWNEPYSSYLDFSNNQTKRWMLQKLQSLQADYNIDSFKFDAGEMEWIPKHTDSNISYFSPSEYIKHYVDLAYESDASSRRQEVRVGCNTQYAPILVRMLDRNSKWGIDNGLKTLIPATLTFGLIGYPFVLPDMIGGNAYGVETVDEELYVRWLQVNVFLPSIQFSIPPWQFNNDTIIQHTRDMLNLRESYEYLFDQLTNETVNEGWPIVRPLWWTDPHDPVCQIIDNEFLLGNDLLVAPVVEPGAVSRDIYLPLGRWKDKLNSDKEIEGPKWINNYNASLFQLPYFQRII